MSEANIQNHSILRTVYAEYDLCPEEAEMQGMDAQKPDNIIWVPICYDLTVSPIRNWVRSRGLPEYVTVEFQNGDCPIFRVSYEEFGEMYVAWLKGKSQQWPIQN